MIAFILGIFAGIGICVALFLWADSKGEDL